MNISWAICLLLRPRIFTDEEWLILKDEKVHLGNGELVLFGSNKI